MSASNGTDGKPLMDISRTSQTPLRPIQDQRTNQQGQARRLERLARETAAPEPRRPERQQPERTETVQREREPREVERSDRRSNVLEGFRAARRVLGSTPDQPGGGAGAANSPGPAADGLVVDQQTQAQPQAGPATPEPRTEVAVLAERFIAAHEEIGTRLESELEGVENPDDIAFLQERAALAEERLFTRFTNAIGGLFLPSEPAPASEPAATEPVARVVNIDAGASNVSSTLVSPAAPNVAADTAPAETVNPEEELVGRLVAANEAIDRRLANALDGVENPDDIAFLQDRADTARERVATRFLNALGSERGITPNAEGPAGALGTDLDRTLVDRFLAARSSFDQRAQNALASATEPGARDEIQARLSAAQDRIAGRLLAALGNAQVAPTEPPIAADPQQGPRTFRLESGQITATSVSGSTAPLASPPPANTDDVAQGTPRLDPNSGGSEQVEGTEPDPRRLFAEQVRAAFEGLRARATQAFEGTETRSERLDLAERLAEARDSLLTRIQHGNGPTEA